MWQTFYQLWLEQLPASWDILEHHEQAKLVTQHLSWHLNTHFSWSFVLNENYSFFRCIHMHKEFLNKTRVFLFIQSMFFFSLVDNANSKVLWGKSHFGNLHDSFEDQSRFKEWKIDNKLTRPQEPFELAVKKLCIKFSYAHAQVFFSYW